MFKKIISLVAIFILLLSFSTIAYAERTVKLNTDDLEKGILKVLYVNDEVSKAKLMLEKDGEKQYYNLSNTDKYEKFSVPYGEGKYLVAVYENVQATQYIKAYAKYVDVRLVEDQEGRDSEEKIDKVKEEEKERKTEVKEEKKEEKKVKEETKKVEEKIDTEKENKDVKVDSKYIIYLQSTREINFEASTVAVKLAKDLTKDAKTDEEKAKIIHKYITSKITYDYDKIKRLSSGYIPDMDEFLADGKGICYDYSVLYAGMLRSLNIPTKLVKGYSSVTPTYHAWNEVLIDGEWVVVDTTYDACMNQYGYSYNFEKSEKYYSKTSEA